MADPTQLENAVLNLAPNARNAMPGGGRLSIEMANMVLNEDYTSADHELIPGNYATSRSLVASSPARSPGASVRMTAQVIDLWSRRHD